MRKTTFNPLLTPSDIETVRTDSNMEDDDFGSPSRGRKNNNNTHEMSSYGSDEIFEYDQQPEHRVGYRTYFAAFMLFFGGLALVIYGAIEYWDNSEPRGLDMFIVGLIMMLPGTYGMSIVVGHLKGWIRNDTRGLILYD